MEKNTQFSEWIKRVRPERSGVLLKPHEENVDHDFAEVVGQKGYALARADHYKSRILQTYSLSTCVAWAAYEPVKKIGFMAHLDRKDSVPFAHELILKYLGENYQAVISGGVGDRGEDLFGTAYLVAAIEAKMDPSQIIGLDVLGHTIRSLALDTVRGRFFIPKNIAFIEGDAKRALLDKRIGEEGGELTNDGLL